MKSMSKAIAKMAAFLVLAFICCAELPMLSCFGAKYEPGDIIPLPPLPPSDTMMGFFSKFKTGDNLDSIYKLKDLPITDPTANPKIYPQQPSVISFNGELLLYYIERTEYDAPGTVSGGILTGISTSVKVAKMEAASPYVDTGPNGIAESGIQGDDWQLQPVGATGLAPTDTVVTDGGNGTLETLPAGDDVVSGLNILAGPDGIAESGFAVGDVQGALIPVQAIGALNPTVLEIKYYSQIGIPAGQGEPNRLAVSAGADGLVQTPCIFDDGLVRSKDNSYGILSKLSNGIYSGIEGITQSGIGPDDIQLVRARTNVSPHTLLILPGPDGKLQTRVNGGSDIQVASPGSQAGVGALVVQAPPGGVLTTCPAGDNYIILGTKTAILAGASGIAYTTVTGDDMEGAMDGGNGLSNSGLGGDDYQLVSAADPIMTGVSLPVVSSGDNKALETPLRGNEVEAIYHLEWFPSGGSLTTSCAPGGSTCAIAESGRGGDDIQVVPGGTTGLASTDFVIDGNGVLETAPNVGMPLGDDYICDGAGVADPSGNYICAGTDGIAESGVWGDDIQVVRKGQASLLYPILDTDLDTIADTEMIFPVILPGTDGVLQTPAAPGDNRVIMKYSTDNTIMSNLIFNNYGVGPLVPPDLPNDTTDVVASGLGGRGLFDAIRFVNCPPVLSDGTPSYVFDNGTATDTGDPFLSNPAPSECKLRYGYWQGPDWVQCSDDCQLKSRGSVVGPQDPIILAGHNQKFDTALLVDDGAIRAIVDGGNGIAESGLGGDDTQIIPAGRGQPNTMEIVAATNADGAPRVLGSLPAGDDRLIYPSGVPDLSGDGIFTKDNLYTIPDPDGDNVVENWATVDDGEYFSWKSTNVTNNYVPSFYGNPTTGNIVDDLQGDCSLGYRVDAGSNGVLETAPIGDESIDGTGTQILCGSIPTLVDRRGILSFHILSNPVNAAELLAYLSNGRDIYLTRSTDGENWDPPQLVLSAGGNGGPGDPVVLSGVDGICETTAAPNNSDIQAIPLGQGQSNTIAFGAGPNKKIDSVPRGDDYVDGLVLRTGANGIRETPVIGDDLEIFPIGRGQPDSACILAGANGRRDTPDYTGTPNVGVGATKCCDIAATATIRHCSSDNPGATVGDDRPPFMERKLNYQVAGRNSADFFTCNPWPPALYGSTCPWLPDQNEPAIRVGNWAGFDSMGIKDPFVIAFEGQYYMYYAGTGALIEPEPVRPKLFDMEAFGPCPRIGLNQTMDPNFGVSYSFNADNNSSVVVADRIGVATSIDGVSWTKMANPVIPLSNICGSAVDLSLITNIIPGLPIFSPIPGSSRFDYNGTLSPVVAASHNVDGSPIFAMLYTGQMDTYDFMFLLTGQLKYTGTKTSIGLARSFDGLNWTKMTDQSPVFVNGMLGSPDEESSPAIQGLPDSYLMFYQARDTVGRGYIALASRYGAVFPSCLSVARTPFASLGNTGATACFILLMSLPAMVLIARRIYKRRRR